MVAVGSVAEKGEMTRQAKSQCSVKRRDRTRGHRKVCSQNYSKVARGVER